MRLRKITISGMQEWMDSWYDPSPWPQRFWDMAQQRRREHEAWMQALEDRLLSGDLIKQAAPEGSEQAEIPEDVGEERGLDDPERLIEWIESQAQNIEPPQCAMVVI